MLTFWIQLQSVQYVDSLILLIFVFSRFSKPGVIVCNTSYLSTRAGIEYKQMVEIDVFCLV